MITVVAKDLRGNVLAAGQDKESIMQYCLISGCVYKSQARDLNIRLVITYNRPND